MNNNAIKKTFLNTIMLYLLAFSKMIIPLITLPYLTRVLSVESYGAVSYVKSVIAYSQLIVDFGFILSSVKDIVNANRDKNTINRVISKTVFARLLLSILSIIFGIILFFCVPTLNGYFLYVMLSLIVPLLSSFYMDVLFRGLEKMHYISIVYVISHLISTFLTFILVKDDNDILLIPLLNIVSSLITIFCGIIIASKNGYKLIFVKFKEVIEAIKDSSIYFANNITSTAFGALNTIFIGIAITDLTQVAYWSAVMQLIGAVQSLYTPIGDGIYPYMVKEKNMKLIKKTVILLLPIVIGGCLFCFFCAKPIILILCGEKYIDATLLFKLLIPVLFLSFPVALFGVPGLGAIGKMKYVTISTIIAASIQILGLISLIIFKSSSIYYVAIIRNISELALLLMRWFFIEKFKSEFNC